MGNKILKKGEKVIFLAKLAEKRIKNIHEKTTTLSQTKNIVVT